MLKKVLKYDLSSVGRIWWIIAVSVLAMTLFSSLVMRMVTEQILTEHPFLMIIAILLFIFTSHSLSIMYLSIEKSTNTNIKFPFPLIYLK